ncbi:fucose isomerase [Tropicimonas isoalkanivorans]|uniref:L-fucose isomerase, C-terminal domain n=1 Tax=Tropicimonas isoalkanivorans TaxID=441112 RepID=A0A1I1PUD2_9RHOB|nr:fucose isomerase [Tropicimonas isoalkanivorans]SFD13297.1 L-fucose isomerase, C-terminal domain [Tropicimonas isoalkanivorans]
MTDIVLVASGDLRESANLQCWPAQAAMEAKLTEVIEGLGHSLKRAHPVKPQGHGFIASQREGMDVFASIDPDAPLIVAEAVWQYSHHVLPGLTTHKGPILTVANWSGQWPGLVGLLNLNGSLTKAGVPYASLWSVDFGDAFFLDGLREWLETGTITHDASHVRPFAGTDLAAEDRAIAAEIAADLRRNKTILGVFDEGCMGMFNAIIPDALLMPLGVFKERLSQSALYHAAKEVPEAEARAVYDWLLARGITFHLGDDPETDLTEAQVLDQCRMYIAAVRMADAFGCEAIGIQYQQGLKDLLPASDLVEGMLNNDDRPDVARADGTVIRQGRAIVHFNEVDECAGLDGVLINRVHRALGQPVETTLHDLRWGEAYGSGVEEEFVWVFEISGAVPPAHNAGGWAGSESFRQPAMYFPAGGGSLMGIAKPGEIVWSRIFVEGGQLHMDIGRGQAVELPEAETLRRSESTTPEWPIMHGVLTGVSRDQMMARHKANHIQVVYATSAEEADKAMYVRAALAQDLGITVSLCGV